MKKTRYIGLILTGLLLISAAGCAPDLEQEKQTRPGLYHLSSHRVELEAGRSRSFSFEVAPLSMLSESTGYRFELKSVLPDGKTAAEDTWNQFFRLVSVAIGEGSDVHSTRYHATVEDLRVSDKYAEKVVVRLTLHQQDGSMLVLETEPLTIHSCGNTLFSFGFRPENNGSDADRKAVLKPVQATIKGNHVSVSSPYLTSPKLVADFRTNASKIYVNGTYQEAGVTANDFSRPITYKMVSSKGEAMEYVVSVEWSGLPVLEINTPESAAIPSKKENWLPGTEMLLYTPQKGLEYQGKIDIRGRGNSTWHFPKKPYNIKLPVPTPVLGMRGHKRWALLANWLDRTMLRNDVSLELARRSSLAWTPSGEFVELVLNGKHQGCYFLCENIRVDDDRLDLVEMLPSATQGDDITGGYLFEMDISMDKPMHFRTPYANLPFMSKEPELLNAQQTSYVKSYINDLEKALTTPSSLAAGTYRDMMDVDSFVDWWLVYELTGNKEPKHPKSVYMHKDRCGKLTAGPVWDFDWGTYTASTEINLKNAVYYKWLFQDPWFKKRVKERWSALKPQLETLPDYISRRAEMLKASDRMNHRLWPIDKNVNGDIKLEYEEAVKQMKKNYLQRFKAVDRFISQL